MRRFFSELGLAVLQSFSLTDWTIKSALMALGGFVSFFGGLLIVIGELNSGHTQLVVYIKWAALAIIGLVVLIEALRTNKARRLIRMETA